MSLYQTEILILHLLTIILMKAEGLKTTMR